jgi:hypothetical protein
MDKLKPGDEGNDHFCIVKKTGDYACSIHCGPTYEFTNDGWDFYLGK